MHKFFLVLILMVGSLIISACGGGDDGGNEPIVPESVFFGVWKGIITSDADTTASLVELWFDRDGTPTQVIYEGIPYDASGSVTKGTGYYVFDITYNGDTIRGLMLLDNAEQRLGVIVRSSAAYGILQKDLLGFSFQAGAFSESDLVGAWDGYTVTVDQNFNVVDVYDSSNSYDPPTGPEMIPFSGTDKSGAFTGTTLAFHDDIGYYRGDYTGPGAFSGNIVAMVSADKQSVFEIVCDATVISHYVISDVSACTYSMRSK